MKVLSKKEMQKNGKSAQDEIRILRQLDNKLFVRYKEELQDREFIYLVMEFVPGGDIFCFLKKQKSLDEPKVQFMAAQVVLMMDHLH